MQETGQPTARLITARPKPRPSLPAVFRSWGLSEREAEVASLLADGFVHKDVAAMTGLCPETVRWHAKRIYRKLHVGGQKEIQQQVLIRLFGVDSISALVTAQFREEALCRK